MKSKISITPSEVLEFLYCPRFIYFMSYLKIPQHQEKRFKVIKGRNVHSTPLYKKFIQLTTQLHENL